MRERFEQHLMPIDESLQGQLVGIMCAVQLKMFEDYKALHGDSSRPVGGLDDGEHEEVLTGLSDHAHAREVSVATLSENRNRESPNGRIRHRVPVEMPISSSLGNAQPTGSHEPSAAASYGTGMPCTGSTSLSSQAMDEFGLPQEYPEYPRWDGASGMFPDGSHPSSWSSIFEGLPADLQPTASAPVFLPVMMSTKAISQEDFIDDADFVATGSGFEQLSGPFDDTFG